MLLPIKRQLQFLIKKTPNPDKQDMCDEDAIFRRGNAEKTSGVLKTCEAYHG
jgi:hypothetical protein